MESILASRLKGNNSREFLIKWKGYGQEEATWEPESNLGNAQRLLSDFVRRMTTGTVATRRGSSVRPR